MSCAALSPLAAYLRSERQKRQLAGAWRGRVLRLHRAIREQGAGVVLRRLHRHSPESAAAARAFAAAGPDEATIVTAYREAAMAHGTRRIDPGSRRFARDVRTFHRHYVANFPLPEEQESREGFSRLWSAGIGPGGYEELAFATHCPFTGGFLMGVNFTVQPLSASAHFIYGFVSPIARGLAGFSDAIIALIRDQLQRRMAAHYAAFPQDRPAFAGEGPPPILFEKNIVGKMTLTDILMDSAHIDVARPPGPRARLSNASVSPNLRDLIWDRRGGRIVDYAYLQSSLDGPTVVSKADEAAVIALLRGKQDPKAAEALQTALGDKTAGCTVLDLCAFADPGAQDLPAAQILEHNRIFQGTSVIKQPDAIAGDIYFRAQCEDLAARSRNGRIGLRAIVPYGADGFDAAEDRLKRLLARTTWERLAEAADWTYAEWIERGEERVRQ